MEQGNQQQQAHSGDSLSRGVDVSLKVQIVAAMVIAALMLWGRPYWLPWVAGKLNAAVQTSAQGGCR